MAQEPLLRHILGWYDDVADHHFYQLMVKAATQAQRHIQAREAQRAAMLLVATAMACQDDEAVPTGLYTHFFLWTCGNADV